MSQEKLLRQSKVVFKLLSDGKIKEECMLINSEERVICWGIIFSFKHRLDE